MPEENENATGAAEVSPEGHQESDAVPPGQAKVESCKCECRQKSYWAKPENWVSLGTLGAVTIYTGITAVILCNSAKQLDQVIAANELTRYSLTAVSRAFVVFQGIKITQGPASWKIAPKWENTGNTGTYELGIFKSCPVATDEIANPVATIAATPTTLGPKQKISIEPCEIGAADIDLVRGHHRHLYVVGRAEYKDTVTVWPHSRYQYVTKSCAEIVDLVDANNYGLRLCPTHNCADDDCKK